MLIRKAPSIRSSEITPKSAYLNRRRFLGLGAAAAGAAAAASVGIRLAEPERVRASTLPAFTKSPLSTSEKATPLKDIASYNNYYEFSTDKYEPASLAKNFKTRPWTV